MTAVTASPTSTQKLANSPSTAPVRFGPAGAAAPARSAVSPGISATHSVWSDIDAAVKEEVSASEACFQARVQAIETWHDGYLDPKAEVELNLKTAEKENATKKLISAIAASPLSADDIRTHFGKSDPATQTIVDWILLGTTVEDLKAARPQTSGSQTKSDPGQWKVLDRAVVKVLSTKGACDRAQVQQSRDDHSGPKEMAWIEKLAENKKAEKELASAILASPFSAQDIRDHFAKSVPQTWAVDLTLRGSAFERR
jgi:hypothetical protein